MPPRAAVCVRTYACARARAIPPAWGERRENRTCVHVHPRARVRYVHAYVRPRYIMYESVLVGKRPPLARRGLT